MTYLNAHQTNFQKFGFSFGSRSFLEIALYFIVAVKRYQYLHLIYIYLRSETSSGITIFFLYFLFFYSLRVHRVSAAAPSRLTIAFIENIIAVTTIISSRVHYGELSLRSDVTTTAAQNRAHHSLLCQTVITQLILVHYFRGRATVSIVRTNTIIIIAQRAERGEMVFSDTDGRTCCVVQW